MGAQYEDRFVAFVDILGFKGLVARTVQSPPRVTPDEIEQALAVAPAVDLQGVEIGRLGDLSDLELRRTCFSDCFVMSTEASEAGLVKLLLHLRAIASRLVRLHVLPRGGVTRGPLYHSEKAIFGPAMI